jgi:hypothetical protein
LHRTASNEKVLHLSYCNITTDITYAGASNGLVFANEGDIVSPLLAADTDLHCNHRIVLVQ